MLALAVSSIKKNKLTIQLRQIIQRQRASAALHLADERHKAFQMGNGDPGATRQLQDRCELRVALGLAVVNDNVTPNAAMCLRRAAVERHHGVEGCVDGRTSSIRTKRR